MIQQEQMNQLQEVVIRESKEMVAVTLERLLRPRKKMMMKMMKKMVRREKAALIKKMMVKKRKMKKEKILTLTLPPAEEDYGKEQLQLRNDRQKQ
jgi:hypothetical protein